MLNSVCISARQLVRTLALVCTLAMLLTLGGLQQATASTLYWDANGAAGGTGGTGDWNLSNVAWRDGSAVGTLQPWVDNNDVNLPTTAGTLTLKSNITIGQSGTSTILTSVAGYTINADPGFSLIFDATGGSGAYRISTLAGGSLVINAPVILKGYNQNPRGTVTFNGDISETGGSIRLVKNLSDTMTLSGNNSFTGGVDLSQGTLVVGHNNALGTAALSWNSGTTLSASGGARTLPNAVLGSWNYAHTISGTNPITFNGNYNAMSAFGTSVFASMNISDPNGLATFKNFTTQTSGANGGFKKLGPGTMIVDSTFTPGNMSLSVEAGTLLINTSSSTTSGASTITVNGGTLGGTGTLNLGVGSALNVQTAGRLAGTLTINGGSTTIAGTHAPGNSAGIMTFGTNLTYSGGTSAVEWQLVGNTATNAPNPSALFDSVVIGGNLNFSGATSLSLSFNSLGSSVLWNDSFWLSSHLGTGGWLLYDVAGTTSNFSNLNLVTTNWLDSANNGFSYLGTSSFSLFQSGSDIYLNYTYVPVPEPSSLSLLGLASLLLVARRKRK